MTDQPIHRTVTCAIVGDSLSGKTNVSYKYITGEYLDDYVPTGLKFLIKGITIDSDNVQLGLWDTSGIQFNCTELNSISHPRLDVVLLAFNLFKTSSLRSIVQKWYPEIRKHMPEVPIVLAGMQSDGIGYNTDLLCTEQKIKDVITKINPVGYYTCSSLQNDGVTELFENMCRFVITGYVIPRKVYNIVGKYITPLMANTNPLHLHRDITSCKSDMETLGELRAWSNMETLGELRGWKDYIRSRVTNIRADKPMNQLNLFLTNVEKTIIHFLLEKKYSESAAYFLAAHQDDVIKMINIIDTSGRVPMIVAADNGFAGIAKMLYRLAIENNVNFSECIDYKGEKHDMTTKIISHCASQNYDDLLLPLVRMFEYKHNTDAFKTSVLMAVNNDELVNNLLPYANLSIIKIRNAKDENLAHVFGKKGFTKSIITLLEKIPKLEASLLSEYLQQEDLEGNTPPMSTAISEQSSALVAFLLSYMGNPRHVTMDKMLHHRNRDGYSILYLVHQSSQMMFGPYGILLELEKTVHMKAEADISGFLDLQDCLRQNHGSSRQTIKILNFLKDTTQKSSRKLFFEKFILFFGVFLFPAFIYIFDVTTDSLLANWYRYEWRQDVMENESPDVVLLMNDNGSITASSNTPECNFTSTRLEDFPECLSNQAKFLYSMFFILLPWIFYGYEFFHNEFFNVVHDKVIELVEPICRPNIYGRVFLKYLILSLSFSICFIAWPLLTIFIHCYHFFKYENSKGVQRNNLGNKHHETMITSGRARLLEVCTEATFQLLLQWYLLFPNIMENLIHFRENGPCHRNLHVRMHDLLPYLSLVSSIFSLAWSFTAQRAIYKRGALDVRVSPVSRAVIFLSNLLLIISRMNCLILFMYYWGPGQLYPGVIFLLAHLFLAIILHNFFSQDMTYFREGHFVKYFHSCLINGLANMFSSNGHVMVFATRQNTKEKTLVRHMTFDFIFLIENIVLAAFGYNLMINEHQSTKDWIIFSSLVCHGVGLVLKMVYYTELHIWSDLIRVVQKDGKQYRLKCY